MALPLGWLVWMSVSTETAGATLGHYAAVLQSPAMLRALWNTVVLAFWVGLASLAVGAPLAWLTARTDLPATGLIRSLVLASFVTPPFLGAFAWVMLAGPNAGYLNQLYRRLTGADGPLLDIFSMPGLIFVVAIYTFPYVYIMIANTLGLIASDLEDAAAILGAGRLQVARTITLPLVLPAILSGFILAVLQALALFGSPAILALPAGFHTVTTQLWSFFQYPPRAELAAAFSIPLLLATALLLLVQKKLLGRRGYAAVGGKGGQRRAIRLGPWRYPALAGCLVVLAGSVFLPYGILLKAAFARAWAQPLTRANFTLENWSFTFLHGATQSAIVNTLELGALTACVGAGLATLLAYVTNRRLVVGHQVLGFLALAPVVIPGVVLAVALFVAYTRPPFLLYGTLWILFLAYLTKEMPVGYSQADATLRGIHPELEEAGRILGAGRLRVLREITAPLARSGIIATWCFVFIGVIRELSASIILFTPNTKVISVVIFDLKEEGQFGAIAVLGVFMLVMTFATVALMQALLGRDALGARSSAGAG
jgi:iron(III) transport system permease protein